MTETESIIATAGHQNRRQWCPVVDNSIVFANRRIQNARIGVLLSNMQYH